MIGSGTMADSQNQGVSERFPIERFNGENFHLWRFQMNALFAAKGLTGIIDGTETSTVATVVAWTKKDSMAISYICQGVDRRILQNLITCTSAHAMWEKLTNMHELAAAEHIHRLQQEFYICRMAEKNTVNDFIGEIELIVCKLKGLGDTTFNETAVMTKILCNLPGRFDGFLSAWDGVDTASKTLSNLSARLLREETRHKEREKHESGTKAFAAQKNGKQQAAGSSGGNGKPPKPTLTFEEREKRRLDIEAKKKTTRCFNYEKWAIIGLGSAL